MIDGDTLDLRGQRIRLFGIDAPEHDQTCEAAGATYRCGQQAALALSDHIGSRPVTCEQRDVDRYHRIVAICTIAGEDLNAWMVRQGWALAYRQYSTAYVPDEDAAHAAGAGMWRGSFTAPWDFRHGVKTTTGQAPQTSAPQEAGKTCCKVCSKGKACGNSCIQRSRTCHQPPGCACDARQ